MSRLAAAEALEKAREKVEKGWTKGGYSQVIDGQRCYCTLGALEESNGRLARNDLVDLIAWAIRKRYPKWVKEHYARWGPVSNRDLIWHWNDLKHRKQEHVLRVFDDAIKVVS